MAHLDKLHTQFSNNVLTNIYKCFSESPNSAIILIARPTKT